MPRRRSSSIIIIIIKTQQKLLLLIIIRTAALYLILHNAIPMIVYSNFSWYLIGQFKSRQPTRRTWWGKLKAKVYAWHPLHYVNLNARSIHNLCVSILQRVLNKKTLDSPHVVDTFLSSSISNNYTLFVLRTWLSAF